MFVKVCFDTIRPEYRRNSVPVFAGLPKLEAQPALYRHFIAPANYPAPHTPFKPQVNKLFFKG